MKMEDSRQAALERLAKQLEDNLEKKGSTPCKTEKSRISSSEEVSNNYQTEKPGTPPTDNTIKAAKSGDVQNKRKPKQSLLQFPQAHKKTKKPDLESLNSELLKKTAAFLFVFITLAATAFSANQNHWIQSYFKSPRGESASKGITIKIMGKITIKKGNSINPAIPEQKDLKGINMVCFFPELPYQIEVHDLKTDEYGNIQTVISLPFVNPDKIPTNLLTTFKQDGKPDIVLTPARINSDNHIAYLPDVLIKRTESAK